MKNGMSLMGVLFAVLFLFARSVFAEDGTCSYVDDITDSIVSDIACKSSCASTESQVAGCVSGSYSGKCCKPCVAFEKRPTGCACSSATECDSGSCSGGKCSSSSSGDDVDMVVNGTASRGELCENNDDCVSGLKCYACPRGATCTNVRMCWDPADAGASCSVGSPCLMGGSYVFGKCVSGSCVSASGAGSGTGSVSGIDEDDDDPYYSSSHSSGSGSIVPDTMASEFGLPENPGMIKGILTNVAKWLLNIIGIIAIIAFVISGMQYLFVASDEKMAEKAKKTMTYAVIGIVVALFGLIAIITVDTILRVQL